jgi:hypothetical protein
MLRWVVVVVAVGALLAGCSTTSNDAQVDSGVGQVPSPLGQDCDSYAPGRTAPPTPDLTPLPADSVLVSATRCIFQTTTVAGDGEWLIRTDQRADSGLEALAAALRLPSQGAPANVNCDLIGYLPIVITVTDTKGRQLKPKVPHEACGGPLTAAVDAIAAVQWQTVATHQVRQTQSQMSIDTGCPDQYKPVIALEAAFGAGSRQPLPFATDVASLQVCRYILDPDPAYDMPLGNNGSGGVAHSGRLASVSTVDIANARAFLAAVAAAPPALPCTQPEAPFANVGTPGENTVLLTVELGGCSRVLIGSELRQLDAATVSKLMS